MENRKGDREFKVHPHPEALLYNQLAGLQPTFWTQRKMQLWLFCEFTAKTRFARLMERPAGLRMKRATNFEPKFGSLFTWRSLVHARCFLTLSKNKLNTDNNNRIHQPGLSKNKINQNSKQKINFSLSYPNTFSAEISKALYEFTISRAEAWIYIWSMTRAMISAHSFTCSAVMHRGGANLIESFGKVLE